MTLATGPWRTRVARACDLLAGLMVVQAIWTHAFGGYRLGAEPFVLSTRSAGRILIEVLAVIAVRHLMLPTPSLRDRIAGWLRARPSALAPVPLREWMIAAAALVPITTYFLWPQIVMLAGVPDRGDPLFSMWALAHVTERLTHAPATLLDGRIFHPAEATYAWSDMSLLPGLLAAPFLWLGVPLAHVYGGMMVAACWLSGITMFGLARAAGNVALASGLAAALFAFLPYRFAQYSHLAMQGTFLLPLCVWAAIRVLEDPVPRRAAALGTVVALQVWWSTYLGAFVLVALGGVTAGWWLSGRPLLRLHLRGVGIAAALGVVLLTPYLLGYVRAHGVVGERPRDEVASFSGTLADYTSPNSTHAWYGRHAPIHTKTAERHLASGIAPWVLAAAGVFSGPATLTVMAATGLLVSLGGSLGLNSLTYQLLYDYIPLLRPFRVPARFALLAGLFLTLAAAVGFTRLWQSSTAWWLRGLCCTIAVMAIVESRPVLRLTPVPTSPSPIYASLPDIAGTGQPAVLLELPVSRLALGEFPIDPWYLYMSTFHGHTLINGYSGHFPPWYRLLGHASAELPSAEAFDTIAARGADDVIVHEEFYGTERYRAVVAGLDQSRHYTAIATARTTGGEDRLYRVTRD